MTPKRITPREERFIQDLTRKVRFWGGDVRQCDSAWLIGEYNKGETRNGIVLAGTGNIQMGVSESVGIDFKKKVLYYDPSDLDQGWDLAFLIHETGHIFTSRDMPDDQIEEAFLGWEYLLAKELDVVNVWKKMLDGYYVNLGILNMDLMPDFDYAHAYSEESDQIHVAGLKRDAFYQLINERIVCGIKARIIRRGKAVSVR